MSVYGGFRKVLGVLWVFKGGSERFWGFYGCLKGFQEGFGDLWVF